MNYKQKYEEALEKAKAYHYHSPDAKEVLEIVFPEIAEGEDERIRKALVEYFDELERLDIWANYYHPKTILAWLEKQKPTLSKGDEEHLNNAIWACLHEYGKDSDTAEWLKSLVEQL